MSAKRIPLTALLALITIGANSASADVILPVSYYNMKNGDGTGANGDFNYWDGTYGGSAASPTIQVNRITDQGFLSGSAGVLTNGFIAVDRWDYYATQSGTGQYVGWNTLIYGNPSILFHLAGHTDVHSINFYVDNSYVGLVGGPSSLTINGTTYNSGSVGWTATPLTPPIGFAGGAEKITISGLNLLTQNINVTLGAGPCVFASINYCALYDATPNANHIPANGNIPWIMLSEVQFNGVAVNAVPELSTWTLMLIGFAGLGYVSYRRKAHAALFSKR